MSACVFCAICSGDLPAKIAYQDTRCVVFEDNTPKAPVHLLIVPRQHLAGFKAIHQAGEALVGHLLMVAATLAEELRLERGYRLVINHGADAGQAVDHLHVHLLAGKILNDLV